MMTKKGEEKVVVTACNSHCGGPCLLKVYVRDGVITRIETDDGNEEPQIRACMKCRAYRQRVYAPDRLKYPMKRVGARGEGKFQRISWDEALDTVASEIKRVRDTYGPSAIFYRGGGGDVSWLHCFAAVERLLDMAGGCTKPFGVYSYEAGLFAERISYGTTFARNSRDDLLNSRLIIMWAWDPSSTRADSTTTWYLAKAREAGTRIVTVDPRYTDSAAAFAHHWIPIIPGTDTAMLIAMAHVMIKEQLYDRKFIDTCTTGFERFRDYVLGVEDGVPKSPAWAEGITGVPATTISDLAREYATTRPAALIAGIGPGRTAMGEQYHRAAVVLAAMTGNVGIHGGNAAGRSWTARHGYPFMKLGGGMWKGRELVKPQASSEKSSAPAPKEDKVHFISMADAFLKGKAGGYPADYKLLYVASCNYLNQNPNANKTAKALHTFEFIVVHEHFMTPIAKFADILLPHSTFLERNDIVAGEAVPFYGYINQAIEPQYECKSHLEICTELAKRLGIPNFNDKVSEDDWIKDIVAGSAPIPDWAAFREKAIYRVKLPEPYVAFKSQVEKPQSNPFPTPSGKIEIYSKTVADIGNPLIPPIPKYLESWEGRNDPLAKKYPLQLLTTHSPRRAHSQWDNIPWLTELMPQAVKINAADAKARGIRDGDMVRVFNDRGVMLIPARVTERIMPGVVDVPQGAWYNPDEKGIDKGGCANTLTNDVASPAGAACTNTALVQVQKA